MTELKSISDKVIPIVPKGATAPSIAEIVTRFELYCGDLDQLVQSMGNITPQDALYQIYDALNAAENSELRLRWKKAYDRHVLVRLRLSQLKALQRLENIGAEAKQTDAIAFAKLVLSDYFTAQIQTAKGPQSSGRDAEDKEEAEDAENEALERARIMFDGT